MNLTTEQLGIVRFTPHTGYKYDGQRLSQHQTPVGFGRDSLLGNVAGVSTALHSSGGLASHGSHALFK